ncbi:MAG: DUF4274 domain-containing protein [Pirellulales bacterium]
MAISKRRQQEIIDLATPGVPPGTPEELWNDDAALDPLIRAADKKRKVWLQSTTDPKELHLFAQNWHWDGGGGKQLLPLVDNPHCDAGTMLMLFWHGGGEDMYFQFDAVKDVEDEFNREIHRLLRRIEKKIVAKDYATSNIYFDPESFISMPDRRDEFARQIPEVLCKPIGRKPRGKPMKD